MHDFSTTINRYTSKESQAAKQAMGDGRIQTRDAALPPILGLESAEDYAKRVLGRGATAVVRAEQLYHAHLPDGLRNFSDKLNMMLGGP